MNTYLTSQWGAFWKDVWLELFPDERVDGDFFIEVARVPYEYERKRLSELLNNRAAELDAKLRSMAAESDKEGIARLMSQEEQVRDGIRSYLDPGALSDPRLAHDFLHIFHTRQVSEDAVCSFVVGWHSIIFDMNHELAAMYADLVRDFFEKRNLRYRIRFSSRGLLLEYNPAILFAECFYRLRHFYSIDSVRADIYEDFDKDIRELIFDESESRVRSVMRTSSNLLERSANICAGQDGMTLGKLMGEGYLPDELFPHENVKELIRNYNRFLNDYPALRHTGTEASKNRSLLEKDAVFLGSLSALFSDYLLRK